jgi:RNA polymerase sigma-70 factor (ECF subfamily)
MVPVRHIGENEQYSDEHLLKAYQANGKQEELAMLYMRYTDLVYGTALKYLKDRESAKDAVMNIYQELVTKLKTHAVDNFKSWLYVVTKNHCLMQLRKENKTIIVEFQADLMQSEDFSHLDDVLEKEKEFKKLEGCIGSLNKEQKNIIELFYLQSKCYNEIVDITGQDWNTIRSMIQNGRRNLKKCMDKHG